MKSRPDPKLETTTLWDFPSQNYGAGKQGDPDYAGATPSHVIWNLLERYTRRGDLVVDPMCGSGTTLDVARDLGRRALGYDLEPFRRDIFRADARALPLEDGKADFVFVDPPYSTHLRYSGKPGCIGELSAHDPAYFAAMEQVFVEMDRVLRADRWLAVYAGDTRDERGFVPIGLRLLELLSRRFTPFDVVAVARHNKTLHKDAWHEAAAKGNFFLRGFHYLLIMAKGEPARRSGPS